MAQVTWTYLDNHGGQHRVGLYHGDQSGHLVIHCNLRVVQLDFLVKTSRTYSFFIEDELCEVRLEKIGNQAFTYEFAVNEQVDTPRNRVRKADRKRNGKYMVFLVVGIVGLIAAIFFGLRWYGQEQRKKQLGQTSLFSNLSENNVRRLAMEGKTAAAQLVLVQEALHRKVFYGFTTADSNRISGSFVVADTGQVVLPNGFPLTDHDAFQARYLPSDPQVHRLDFLQPLRSTISNYIRLAGAAEQRAHPQATPQHGLCLALVAAESKGWNSLADIIFQSKSPQENKRHNRDAYQRLLRDVDFEKAAKEACWDQ